MFINDVLFFEGVSDSLCNFGAPDLSNKEEVFDRGTVPVNNFLLTGTVSNSSLTQVAILQTTGSPPGTGFPSTSGQNSGNSGASLRGTLSGWGNLFETLTISGFQSQLIRNY